MKGLDRILELQALDSEADHLVARREELESGQAIDTARRAMETLQSQLGETRLALDAIVTEQTRLENDVGMLDQKRKAEETRLYDGSVANPKELEAIQAEVANIAQRQSRYEDEILAQMERREAFEAKIPGLEAELEAARAKVDELGSSSEQELVDIAARSAELESNREQLLAMLEDELLDTYEGLRSSKKGLAAVELIDGVCQGCHQQLSPVELARIRKQQGLRRCEHCRRILIF